VPMHPSAGPAVVSASAATQGQAFKGCP